MIRKLKIKFILTNMLLISAVMTAAFAFIYFQSAEELENSSITAMLDISERTQTGYESFFDPDRNSNSEYSYLSPYIIDIDTRNNTCYIDGFGKVDQLSEEQVDYINKLINSVFNRNETTGVLEEFNMRFLLSDTFRGKRIVFLDKQYEDDNLLQLLKSFFIIGGIAFCAFLAISAVVAKIAIKPVDKSIKMQQQFISDVSHELKTPITVISTNADIVLSHKDSTVEDEKKWLGYIKDESVRMSELINMMLYLAKTDESREKPALSPFDLTSAAYEVALPFESVCFENNKHLEIDVQPDVFISGDEVSVKQLLVILLDNALKYSNENGKIELSLKTSGDKAVISVYNTGEPIPKQSIPYLFDRFYRVDKARSRISGGSGLGLSIAKRIIENNEASISVSSDEQHGTVFTCVFNLFKNKKKV